MLERGGRPGRLRLTIPERLFGVGMWYRDFSPVSDEEVLALLAEAAAADAAAEATHGRPATPHAAVRPHAGAPTDGARRRRSGADAVVRSRRSPARPAT